ncbi:unnamed protein product, partial [Staurois parvus]
IGRSQELSEFKRGTEIDCHLCNKSNPYNFLATNYSSQLLVVL